MITLKAILQIPGCIYMKYMKMNACWMIQLLGISCIQKFSTHHPVITSSGIKYIYIIFYFLYAYKNVLIENLFKLSK